MRSTLTAVVAALLLLATDQAARAHYYEPCSRVSLASTALSEPSDITHTFGVGVGEDCVYHPQTDDIANYHFERFVSFTPPEWFVAKDADIPDGTVVGTINTLQRLGLLNNPCNNTLQIGADLLDGTTDVANPLDPLPPGTQNRLSVFAQDVDQNGAPDAADRWPSYLSDLADLDGWDLSKIVSRAVGVNTTSLSGTTVVFNLLTFEPHAPIMPGLFPDPRLGYWTVLVMQDPGHPWPASSMDPVNDSCAPFVAQWTEFGTAGGYQHRVSPLAPGPFAFTTLSVSLPDADEDGIENALDPCATAQDPGWDPRAYPTPGDTDNDGVPDSCDPTLQTGSPCAADTGLMHTDEDCDGWMNRGDNCAVAANEGQEDADGDGIGDACDPHPGSADGHFHRGCNVAGVFVGTGGAPTVDPLTLFPCNPLTTTDPGDLDCSSTVDERDVLAGLLHLADVTNAPCFSALPTQCAPATASHLVAVLRLVAGLLEALNTACS